MTGGALEQIDMPAKLVISAGPDEGKVFTLADDAAVTIGRAETANIRLTDPAVSRGHCTLEVRGGKAVLADLGSRTGTRVNGKLIAKHDLLTNEVINVGSTKLVFQLLTTFQPPVDAPADAADHPELRKLSNTKLAHFDLGAVVGVGNSGLVFLAQDVKNDREVALKVYTPAFAEDDVDLQRFIRAVKTMLPMCHKNLVTLYGGGKTGKLCWMAMEYVEGENLKQTIARVGEKGSLDWRIALRMGMDIARGLYYLHSEDIIHRSLSPGNILLSSSGTAKLASLILAKALSGDLAETVTVGDELPGDIRYLAPEQVGSGDSVDRRTDIFSLGTLLYALLVGKTPFEGSTKPETVAWIAQREAMSPRQLNPQIPAPLEKIVLKMLAKAPVGRFQSVGDLLAALEELPKA